MAKTKTTFQVARAFLAKVGSFFNVLPLRYLRTLSVLSLRYLRTLSVLSLRYLRTLSVLPPRYLRTLSVLSLRYLRTGFAVKNAADKKSESKFWFVLTRKCPRAQTHLSGYTLVELLVVLAIVALTTAIIAPRLITVNANKQAKNNSMQMVSLYKKGRNLAIYTGVSQAVTIDTSTKTAWLGGQDKIKFAEDIEIEAKTAEFESGADLAVIRFFPDGTSTGGEVKISSDTAVYVVSVLWATAEVSLENQ